MGPTARRGIRPQAGVVFHAADVRDDLVCRWLDPIILRFPSCLGDYRRGASQKPSTARTPQSPSHTTGRPCLAPTTGSARARSIRRPKPYLVALRTQSVHGVIPARTRQFWPNWPNAQYSRQSRERVIRRSASPYLALSRLPGTAPEGSSMSCPLPAPRPRSSRRFWERAT